jgi:hypothetical protein
VRENRTSGTAWGVAGKRRPNTTQKKTRVVDMKTTKRLYKKPDNSIIDRDMNDDIHYIDSFGIKFKNTNHLSVDYLTALLFSSIPGWVRMLLNLRDFLVKPFGLETGIIPEQETIDTALHYSIGDRAIFFSVIDRTEFEVVMAEDDKHLYFRTSLYVEKTSDQNLDNVYLTTLVSFHNIWGKLYFIPVKPFHKLIMRTLLKNFLINLNN